MLALGADELLAKLVKYTDDLLQACGDQVAEVRHDADSLANRHAAVRRQLRLLYTGYRNLRHKLEDEWPAGAPPRVPHEDAVIGGSVDEIIRVDEETSRQALVRQQNKVVALEAALATAKARQLEYDTLGKTGAGKSSSNFKSPHAMATAAAAADPLAGATAAALQLENSQLRQELDMLKQRLPVQVLFARSGSGVGAQSGAVAGASDRNLLQLTTETAQLRLENQQLRAALNCPGGSAAAGGASLNDAGSGGLRKQLKEFTINTQLDLEKKLK
eukprot:gene4747-4997_t